MDFNGRQVVEISSGDLRLLADPANGMSVVSVEWKGRETIFYDEERFREKRTYGVPILFPTPNRVRDGVLHYRGRASGPAPQHGWAKVSPFRALDKREDSITAVLEHREDSPFFASFPYPLDLTVTISIQGSSVRWDYSVENKGEGPLGYGIALHPFFLNAGEATLKLSSTLVMESGEDLLPTGALLDKAGTGMDFTKGRKISESKGIDSVYYSPSKTPEAEITWPDFSITFRCSDEFRHGVVYTPEGQDFFCYEPQSCSTDCHNLHERGEGEVSGLREVEAGGKTTGWIEFAFRSV